MGRQKWLSTFEGGRQRVSEPGVLSRGTGSDESRGGFFQYRGNGGSEVTWRGWGEDDDEKFSDGEGIR